MQCAGGRRSPKVDPAAEVAIRSLDVLIGPEDSAESIPGDPMVHSCLHPTPLRRSMQLSSNSKEGYQETSQFSPRLQRQEAREAACRCSTRSVQLSEDESFREGSSPFHNLCPRSQRQPLLRRLQSLGGTSEKSLSINYTEASADAYNAYAVVSALVFGFAVNTFTAVAGIVADSDQYQSSDQAAFTDARTGGSPIIWVFCTLLALVCSLSGYSATFMTLQ